MHLTPKAGLQKLLEEKSLFITLFKHGTLSVEIYKPEGIDKQQPHEQDEIYVITSGESRFFNDGEWVNCKTGDLLFVKAGKEHRFVDFTDDFSTWVVFYGPKGGE
ncbi:MAG: cupin domain-containing protein [Saprospiraceae bacterium]|nr:cupin domain-containing protein [Saprospiraceae bacterium]